MVASFLPILAGAFVVAVPFVLHAPRYFNNNAEVKIVPEPGWSSVLFRNENSAVSDWVGVQKSPTVTLPAGRYTVVSGFEPGRTVDHWEITTRGLFSSQTTLSYDSEPAVELRRGGRVILRAVMRDVLPAPCPPSPKSDDGFVQLFNGKDLNGWKTHPDQPGLWRVEEGILVGRYDRNGYLFTARDDYENFHLRADVKIGGNSNGGLLFRCESGFSIDLGEAGGLYPLGYEVDIVQTRDQKARTGSLWRCGKPAKLFKSSPVRPDTWFTLDVVAQGNHVLIKIDGKEIGSYLDPLKSPLPKGHIGLQVAWPETSVIQFRKIEIKELPSEPSLADWVPLFTAKEKDVFGWRGVRWPVDTSGEITAERAGYAETERNAPANSHLRLQTRIVRGQANIFFSNTDKGGWWLHLSESNNVTGDVTVEGSLNSNLANQPLKSSPTAKNLANVGTWFTVDILARNHRAEVQINGAKVLELEVAPDQFAHVLGRVGLDVAAFRPSVEKPGVNRYGKDPLVEFRRIEIKELSPSQPVTSAIDLVPLARLDPKVGTWKREGESLVSIPPRAVAGKKFISALPLPVELPREFMLQAVIERLAGEDSIGFNIPAFGTDFMVSLDAFPQQGWGSGLSHVDGKGVLDNSTSVRGKQLTNGKKHTLQCRVAATGVVASLDGRVLFDYREGYEKLASNRPLYGKERFYIVIVDSPYRIHSLRLIPIAAPPLAASPFDAPKAKEHQEAWAKHLGVPVEFENGIAMKFRLIPPGKFTMGTSAAEIEWLLSHSPDLTDAEEFVKDWVRKEGPARQVTIREPFMISTREVMVKQFLGFVKATGYKTDAEKTGGGFDWNNDTKKWERKNDQVWNSAKYAGDENHPVRFVTSGDVRAFCAWLGKQDGRTYAIPTEEQWEYACRAGTTTRWSFGDDPAAMQKYGWTGPHANGKYHPVGRLAANPFGLFDMYGNVGELVLTARGKEYQRGGTATESPERARSASRVPIRADLDPISTRGFRVAIVGDLKPKGRPAPAVAPFGAKKPKDH